MTTVFLTGATGLIGRWLVPELTRAGHRVIALVRDAAARRAELAADVASRGGDPARLEVVDGDLRRDALGLSPDDRARLTSVDAVYHLGAAMQFGLAPEEAREVNVRGTERVLELAHALGAPRFVLVSGFRVALSAADDAGAYEASKIEADRLVRARAAELGLQLTIVNPSTIIGDSETGETTLFWGLSDLIRDLATGKMPLLPASARDWMPLVTVDFVARFMARVPLAQTEPFAEHFLLDERTPPIDELIERIARHIGAPVPRRRLSRPLSRTLLALAGEHDKAEALAFVAPDRYDTRSAQHAARQVGLELPDFDRALTRSVDFLIATRFGRDRAARGGMARVGGAPTFVRGDRETPDLVLLHGLPLDADSWAPMAASTSLRTLAVDLPGQGRSADEVPSPGEFMRSLLAQVRTRPWLVGQSLGCLYALEHAHAYPERVAGVVLVSPYFLQRPLALPLRCGAIRKTVLASLPRARFVALAGEAHRDYGERLHASLMPGGRQRIADALGSAHASRARLETMLRELQVPVLLVTGERDPLLAETSAPVETIAGAGHHVQLDRPVELARLIERRVAA